MNHKLFLVEELEDQGVDCLPASRTYLETHPDANQVVLGGEVHTVVATEEGEPRRWTRTDLFILKDPEGRHWAVAYEANPTDHDGGAEGFRSHVTDHGNPIHVAAHEVRPIPVQTIAWETVK